MTKALFEKHAKDLGLDLTYSKLYKGYLNPVTRKNWTTWNVALNSKDIVEEVEEPIHVSINGFHNANLYFDWAQNGCGFGQFSISKSKQDGKIYATSEAMSKQWCRKALHAAVDLLIDEAIMD